MAHAVPVTHRTQSRRRERRRGGLRALAQLQRRPVSSGSEDSVGDSRQGEVSTPFRERIGVPSPSVSPACRQTRQPLGTGPKRKPPAGTLDLLTRERRPPPRAKPLKTVLRLARLLLHSSARREDLGK